MQQPIQKKYFKIDDNFRPVETPDYDLLLELGPGISAFAIIRSGNELAGLGIFGNSFFDISEEFPWLKNPFKSVRISLQNNRFTLIPEQLYSEEAKKSYAALMFENSEEKETIFSDFVETAGIWTVYGVPEKFYEKINSGLPGSDLFHISGILIRSLIPQLKVNPSVMLLNVRHEAFDLVIFKEKQLVYCNSFYFQAPEDVVYYLIFVMEQLKIDAENSVLSLSGDIQEQTPLYDLVRRYIRIVDFISPSGIVGFSTLFDDLPRHRVYSLVNTVTCGS